MKAEPQRSAAWLSSVMLSTIYGPEFVRSQSGFVFSHLGMTGALPFFTSIREPPS